MNALPWWGMALVALSAMLAYHNWRLRVLALLILIQLTSWIAAIAETGHAPADPAFLKTLVVLGALLWLSERTVSSDACRAEESHQAAMAAWLDWRQLLNRKSAS